MKNATYLYLLDRETPDTEIAGYAEAALAGNIHLSCMLIGQLPEPPIIGMGIPPYGTPEVPEQWSKRLKEAHQKAHQRVQEIEAILARAGVSADVQAALCATSEIKTHVARRARVSDLAYVAASLRETAAFHEAASGVLFASPIGLVVNDTEPTQPKTVFIAWDGSEAASSAVHAALPLLKTAKDVFVGCFDPVTTSAEDGANPGSGLAAWLSHHGCKVTVGQYPSGGKDIAACIQDRTLEVGADMVVMGAYGHLRWMQAAFGGTSRRMMEQTRLPVFFAH